MAIRTTTHDVCSVEVTRKTQHTPEINETCEVYEIAVTSKDGYTMKVTAFGGPDGVQFITKGIEASDGLD